MWEACAERHVTGASLACLSSRCLLGGKPCPSFLTAPQTSRHHCFAAAFSGEEGRPGTWAWPALPVLRLPPLLKAGRGAGPHHRASPATPLQSKGRGLDSRPHPRRRPRSSHKSTESGQRCSSWANTTYHGTAATVQSFRQEIKAPGAWQKQE